jgi:hypothetical protein
MYWERTAGMIADVSKYDKIVVEKRFKFFLNSLLMELQFKTFFNPD